MNLCIIGLLLVVTFLSIDFMLKKKLTDLLGKLLMNNIALVALAILGGLICVYRSSTLIDTSSFGKTEHFGQFGDFIGGLLNPTFGFITVLLLLKTLKIQKDEIDSFKNLDTKKALEDLLTSSKEEFSKLMKSQILFHNEMFSISSIAFPSREERSNQHYQEQKKEFRKIKENLNSLKPVDIQKKYLQYPNEMRLLEVKDFADEILNIYRDLIKLNTSTTLKISQYRRSRRFLEGLVLNRLFDEEEGLSRLVSVAKEIDQLPEDLKRFNKFGIR